MLGALFTWFSEYRNICGLGKGFILGAGFLFSPRVQAYYTLDMLCLI